MDFLTWLPALTTSGLLAVALWLGRNLISTRLTKSVEYEFNQKLEVVRTQMRESEARLNSELRLKEAEIASLRGGALTALASRTMSLDKRRLEAVDQLWESVNAMAPARTIAMMMTYVNFETAASQAEGDPKVRKSFENFSPDFDIKKIDLSGANKAKPFVTPMVWAIYQTIHSVTMIGLTKWIILKAGLGSELLDESRVPELVKAALPHWSGHIDKNGVQAFPEVLNALDTKLLEEINNMLTGTQSDSSSIKQAAEICRLSNEVNNSIQNKK
jgi:hypothetical protein